MSIIKIRRFDKMQLESEYKQTSIIHKFFKRTWVNWCQHRLSITFRRPKKYANL